MKAGKRLSPLCVRRAVRISTLNARATLHTHYTPLFKPHCIFFYHAYAARFAALRMAPAYTAYDRATGVEMFPDHPRGRPDLRRLDSYYVRERDNTEHREHKTLWVARATALYTAALRVSTPFRFARSSSHNLFALLLQRVLLWKNVRSAGDTCRNARVAI